MEVLVLIGVPGYIILLSGALTRIRFPRGAEPASAGVRGGVQVKEPPEGGSREEARPTFLLLSQIHVVQVSGR